MAQTKPNAPSTEQYRDPVIEAYKSGVDRTLIRENLKLTHQQRLEALQSWMRTIEALNQAGRDAKRGQ
jgi:hypothetical protein